jgi:hypothetical protein
MQVFLWPVISVVDLAMFLGHIFLSRLRFSVTSTLSLAPSLQSLFLLSPDSE